jgi:polar amino acid transport system substrate-binding protein
MSRRTLPVAIAILVGVVLAGGCGTPEATPRLQAPSPPFPEPAGVTTLPEVPLEPSLKCQPKQSLRPLGPLPPPGQMPAGSRMVEIHRRGRLVVGIGANPYLLAFRDPYTGKVQGFEAEIAREIAFAIFGDSASSRVQFKAFDLKDRVSAVQEKTVDIMIAAMTMTCKRWQEVAFSAEYYSGGQQVLVYKNSPFKRIEDLGGKKVCASATSEPNLRTITSVKSKPIPVGAANTADCLLLLQQGQVDAVSTGRMILAGLAAQDPATHVVGPQLTDAPTGILVSHDYPGLVRFVNSVLEKLIANGTWKQLQKTWLSDQIGLADPPVPQYRPEY